MVRGRELKWDFVIHFRKSKKKIITRKKTKTKTKTKTKKRPKYNINQLTTTSN